MTTRQNNKSLTFKIVSVLMLLLLLCTAFFGLLACGSTSTDQPGDDSDFSYAEKDEQAILNGNFEFGTANTDILDYSISTPTNWTFSTDNSAVQSNVASGTINTSDVSYKNLMDVFYKDNDFLEYAKRYITGFETRYEELKVLFTDKDELQSAVVEELISTYFKNPGVHDGAQGKQVLMINAINDNYSGTALKYTSASTITLKKGSYGKISLWVKTQNIDADGKSGVNIRLANAFSGVSQNNFVVYGLASDEWKEYSFYVKADPFYNTTITLTLGLGFGGNSSYQAKDYVQGTAFIDDIKYEEIDALPAGTTAQTYNFEYTNATSENYFVDVNATENVNKAIVYDLNLEDSINKYAPGLLQNVTFSTDTEKGYFTTSNAGQITSQTILGATNSTADCTISSNEIKVSNIVKASYTVEIKDNLFKLAPESYAFISFDIENKLARLDRNGISVYVYDKGANETLVKAPLIITEKDGVQKASVLVKNNFPEKDPDGTYKGEREFYLVFVIGPSDITSVTAASQFATGEVIISNMKIAKGNTYTNLRTDYTDKNNNVKDSYAELGDANVVSYKTDYATKSANSNLYSAFSTIASSNVSLYAGKNNDYSATVDSTTYSFTSVASDMAGIISSPVNINGYSGVESNHIYVQPKPTTGEDTRLTNINTRSGLVSSATDGSRAGLINSKYLDNYKTLSGLADIDTALGKVTETIQPIMIHNSSANSYGFIGSNLTIAKSAYASIQVRVRVVGDASAFIYLVDATEKDKEVLTFSFTPNADRFGNTITGTQSTETLAFEGADGNGIKSTDMNSDGWLTLQFYYATGKTSKNLRIEMWNGSRDGTKTSTGYVFFDDITITSSSAFTEPTSWDTILNTSNIVKTLTEDYNVDIDLQDFAYYKRPLTTDVVDYNKNYPDKAITYYAKPIFLKNESVIYAVANTIDPVAEVLDTDTDKEEDGGEVNMTSFWLSVSSIIIAACLVFAIAALLLRRFFKKRKAKNSDAKSHYNVSSRYKLQEQKKQKEKEAKEEQDTQATEEVKEEEIQDENTEPLVEEQETKDAEPENNETIEEFVYGDVQDFGVEDNNSTQDVQTEETSSEQAENDQENK